MDDGNAWKLVQVDAFASEAFRGNPAAVCLLPRPVPGQWMQSLAAEMNLSETAFVHPGADGGFGLRWFTPTTEVPLCGHATLASAHVLFSSGIAPADAAIEFHTLSGVLRCTTSQGLITLDLPANPVSSIMKPAELEEIVGTRIVYTGTAAEYTLIEIESERKLRELRPNIAALARSPWGELIVTCEGRRDDYDFFSRFFAPAVGIAEDPVTGAAHCVLATYWAKRLGKTTFRAHQASSRGGDVAVELVGDRVRLGGRAVTIFEGTLAPSARPA